MQPEPYPFQEKATLSLSPDFFCHTLTNGRDVVQLTSGDAFCYPLYYYIPSFSQDLKYLVYHRAASNQVQLHRLNLASGESVQLTHGAVEHTGWDNWDDEAGRGILDHRSVLNVATGQVIYFAGAKGEEARAVHVGTLADRSLFRLPTGYYAGGQNCATPDGNFFVYIVNPIGSKYMEPSIDRPSLVVAYEFATGKQQTLCEVNIHIHHVIPYGNEHFIVCHTANGCGLFMTSLKEGGVTILRAGDPGLNVTAEDKQIGGHACHYLTTSQGIAYEVIPFATGVEQGEKYRRAVGVAGGFFAGLYDPFTRARFEFPLPDYFQTVHMGWDPQGLRWFWESTPSWENSSPHKLVFLRSIDSKGKADFWDLTGDWMNYGSKQKSHHHPQLTPDSNWLLLVAGDHQSKTNHIFLLDVADLPATQGVSRTLLSPTGQNDIPRLQT